MSRRPHSLWAALTIAAICLSGCHPTQPFYFNDDGDLDHYVTKATEIEEPDVESQPIDEVTNNEAPLGPYTNTPREFWDLELEEAVRTALENGKVLRQLGLRNITGQQRPEPPDGVLRAGDQAPTVYDPAFANTGEEVALAQFDAQWTTSMFWERNDRPQNVQGAVADQVFARLFEQDTGQFSTQITKVGPTGGQFGVRHNVNYDLNNNGSRLIPSDWNVNFEASFSQPLLAGAGVQFNRIAGPNSPFTGNGSQGFDGVMLARVSTDIELARFEANVRNMVSDVENAYWDLYFDYRNLEALKAGREASRKAWQASKARREIKGAAAEAQAREQFFTFQSQVENALWDLYRDESRLRYMMGLAATDGRLIRPKDEPTMAKVEFEWCEIHAEGISRSVELRQRKWGIKRRELELIAARNLLLPRLDAIGRYRWLGLGDDFINSEGQGNGDSLVGSNAWESMVSGRFQEWQLGLQMTMPIGFRRELAQVRGSELQLARERAILQDAELEVSHGIADAVRFLERSYEVTQTNLDRRKSARDQVNTIAAAVEADILDLDQLLDAQRRQAQSEIDYYRSLTDYNRSIAGVHFRKGSLLEYNNICLTEGPWPAKAQFDAQRLARKRDASYYLNYGFTRPKVVSRGPYDQLSGGSGQGGGYAEGEEAYGAPDSIVPGSETIESPQPTPAKPYTDDEQPMPRTTRTGRVPAGSAAAGNGRFDWGPLELDRAAGGTTGVRRAVAVETASDEQEANAQTATRNTPAAFDADDLPPVDADR